ncbi:MAG: hypothetical protein RLZZ162_183 [Verrucomicrobiota bacterium]
MKTEGVARARMKMSASVAVRCSPSLRASQAGGRRQRKTQATTLAAERAAQSARRRRNSVCRATVSSFSSNVTTAKLRRTTRPRMRSRTVAARPAAEADTGKAMDDTGGALGPRRVVGASRQT